MEQPTKRGSHVGVATVAFTALALASTMLLLFAFVVWLAQVIDSLSCALAFTGLGLAITATVIYMVYLKPFIRTINEQLETIYSVAKLAREGYDWALTKTAQIISYIKL